LLRHVIFQSYATKAEINKPQETMFPCGQSLHKLTGREFDTKEDLVEELIG
jgi:hypothetical protein